MWLEPLRATELTEDTLRLDAPPHVARWARERFATVIEASVQLVLGDDIAVELSAAAGDERTSRARRPPTPHAHPAAASARPAYGLSNPKLTFDQFVIG